MSVQSRERFFYNRYLCMVTRLVHAAEHELTFTSVCIVRARVVGARFLIGSGVADERALCVSFRELRLGKSCQSGLICLRHIAARLANPRRRARCSGSGSGSGERMVGWSFMLHGWCAAWCAAAHEPALMIHCDCHSAQLSIICNSIYRTCNSAHCAIRAARRIGITVLSS
jgi:hypothetical protein